MTDEFSLIKRYFAPLSRHIGDDCAILDLGPGQQLATSVDTLVEAVHFPPGAPAGDVAYRALAAALSDLAAAGARPLAVSLALTLPKPDELWLEQFACGLADALEAFKCDLIGGDTTRGPLTVTVQVFGEVPCDQSLLRSGAQIGDALYLSGATGDAAAALAVMAGSWNGGEEFRDYLLARFYRPTPQLLLGAQLLGCASSAIDISDGLLADAGHLCECSGVAIRVDAQALPLSPALQSLPDRGQALDWALAGGDDYELLFTVPVQSESRVPAGCARIGEVVAGSGVECSHRPRHPGYRHFAQPDALQPPADEPANAPGEPRPFTAWVQFLAFGFGSGLSPKAPGTAGTLVAIPLYLLICDLGLPLYSLVVLLSGLAGIWLCDRASRELGVHDHPGIVWDEFVGYWITLWALPSGWPWVVGGFVVFRFLDILKPWPIRVLDEKVHGGLGIMLDDILAGVAGCLLLHGVNWALAG